MTDAPTHESTETIGFTGHELLALLSFNPGAASDASRKALRLPEVEGNELLGAGYATLVVRELLQLQDGSAVPTGGAARVTAVLTTADRWVEVGVVSIDASRSNIFISSETAGTVLLGARGFGIYDITPVEGGADALDQAIEQARSALEAGELGAPAAASVVVTTLESGSRTASIRTVGEGRWELASEPYDEQGQLTVREVAPEQAFEDFAGALR